MAKAVDGNFLHHTLGYFYAWQSGTLHFATGPSISSFGFFLLAILEQAFNLCSIGIIFFFFYCFKKNNGFVWI